MFHKLKPLAFYLVPSDKETDLKEERLPENNGYADTHPDKVEAISIDDASIETLITKIKQANIRRIYTWDLHGLNLQPVTLKRMFTYLHQNNIRFIELIIK